MKSETKEKLIMAVIIFGMFLFGAMITMAIILEMNSKADFCKSKGMKYYEGDCVQFQGDSVSERYDILVLDSKLYLETKK